MTLEQRIAIMVQKWRDIGQGDHADELRAKMWKLLGQYLK